MLLSSILRVLSDEEIAKIRKEFRLPGRSLRIFNIIASDPSSPPKSTVICKKFKISKENLYRLYSELVDEIISILAPKEEFSTLEFYRKKYLYRPFITESRRIEKQLLREKNSTSLHRLYEYAFMNSMKFPASQMNLDITQEFGEKWHRLKTSPPVDDDLYIAVRVIFLRIASLPSKKKMTLTQMSERAQALLSPIRKRCRNSVNPLVRCLYYQAEWKSCMFNQNNSHKGILWLRRCSELVSKNKENFPNDREEYFNLEIAYELAMNWDKPSEALVIFRRYYHDQTPETPNGAIFLQRMIRIAFLAREFETAREILKRFIGYQIVRATPQIHLMAILMQIKLELIEGSMEAAHTTLSLARLEMNNGFFLAYELQMRGLEIIFTLKQSDLALADLLVRRNIKWLHMRRLSLGHTSWIHFYNMIGAIIRYKMAKDPIRRSLLQHFMNDFRIENPEFFMLLESEIPKITEKKNKKKSIHARSTLICS